MTDQHVEKMGRRPKEKLKAYMEEKGMTVEEEAMKALHDEEAPS